MRFTMSILTVLALTSPVFAESADEDLEIQRPIDPIQPQMMARSGFGVGSLRPSGHLVETVVPRGAPPTSFTGPGSAPNVQSFQNELTNFQQRLQSLPNGQLGAVDEFQFVVDVNTNLLDTLPVNPGGLTSPFRLELQHQIDQTKSLQLLDSLSGGHGEIPSSRIKSEPIRISETDKSDTSNQREVAK